MRILYFATHAAWPLTTGARLRDYHLARQLGSRCSVFVNPVFLRFDAALQLADLQRNGFAFIYEQRLSLLQRCELA